MRHTTRLVIKNCIYGVDKNPLAVELCKVALWLEAHNPGEPLNFLDHHIKCGDAIVGLALREELENGIATEAFKTLPGDEKETEHVVFYFYLFPNPERRLADGIVLFKLTSPRYGTLEETLSIQTDFVQHFFTGARPSTG